MFIVLGYEHDTKEYCIVYKDNDSTVFFDSKEEAKERAAELSELFHVDYTVYRIESVPCVYNQFKRNTSC
jgi:hypothetical protein